MFATLSELSTIDSKGTQVKCDAEHSKLLLYMILFYCSPDLCCKKKVAPSSAWVLGGAAPRCFV
jgi:hypothetical protein